MADTEEEAGFVWNVMYTGPEGFSEHIKVVFKSGKELATARKEIIDTLKVMDAKPKDDRRPNGGFKPRAVLKGPQPDKTGSTGHVLKFKEGTNASGKAYSGWFCTEGGRGCGEAPVWP